MAKLIVTAWAWGQKYSRDDVARLVAGVRRHLKEPHRFVLVTEWSVEIDGVECTSIPNVEMTAHKGCFARLRTFDPEWQVNALGARPGDRIVVVDLDVIATGALDALFCRPDNFCILVGANAQNPCPYNGSLWMLRAGYRPDVWSDFSFKAASKIPFFEFPDDQGWMAAKIPGVTGWRAGSHSGVYAFQKPGWPKGEALPADARLVVFPGWRSPEKFTGLQWVRRHWLGEGLERAA